jgi:hypothetical protein
VASKQPVEKIRNGLPIEANIFGCFDHEGVLYNKLNVPALDGTMCVAKYELSFNIFQL